MVGRQVGFMVINLIEDLVEVTGRQVGSKKFLMMILIASGSLGPLCSQAFGYFFQIIQTLASAW